MTTTMDELTIDELLKLPIKYLNGYLNGLDTYELLYDTRFIKLISTIKDVECYRSIMNKLTKYIDTSIIEKLRLNYYNKIINTFNPNTQTFFFYTNLLDAIRNNKEDIIISYFEDLEHHNLYEIVNNIQSIIKSNLTKEETITILTNLFQELTKKKVIDIIIDTLYQDIYPNVMININEVLNFEQIIHKPIISEENRRSYQMTLKLKKLTITELLAFYSSNIHNNLSSTLYQDIRTCKDYSYNLINTSLINRTTLAKNLDTNASNNFGVDIYRLQKTPFYALVHASECEKHLNNLSYSYQTSTDIGACSCSLIDESHFETFQSPYDHIIFGFENFDINNVVHVYYSDSFSDYEFAYEYDTLPTNNVNKLYTAKTLMQDSSDGYNEIIIKIGKNIDELSTNPPPLEAKYILCYDSITPFDIKYAKKHNLYIVLLETKYYKQHPKVKIKEEKYITYGDMQYFNYRNKKYTYK